MNIFSILLPKHTITYLNGEDTVEQGIVFLLNSGYTAVPVIDDGGTYLGTISEGDFLKVVMQKEKEELKDIKVKELVKFDLDSIVLNTVKKQEIMEKILDKNFVSMLDDRSCFIGIITRRNIIQATCKI